VIRTFRFPAIDRVVHGVGAVATVPKLVDELGGQRVMIVTGRTLATHTPFVDALTSALGARHAVTFATMRAHAPRADIDEAIAVARAADADLLIGYGGSSVTDATKIVALRLVESGGPSRVPQIHVPTTLSSGEWTPAAGMTGDVAGVKTYVADPRMAPFAVVLDPEVTLRTPIELWLSTGVKVLDHACEMLWGPRSHPFTDTLAQESLRRIRRSLPATRADPNALDVSDMLAARLDCQLAGWMSMAGIVNVRVHLSHTLGHQIAARWNVGHGITSCITLPPVLRFMASEHPDGVRRVADAFDIPSSNRPIEIVATETAAAIAAFVARLGLPDRLRDVGANREDFPAVADATITAGQATGYVPSGGTDALLELLESMW
jgi:alcohol dehydrogenase class IV